MKESRSHSEHVENETFDQLFEKWNVGKMKAAYHPHSEVWWGLHNPRGMLFFSRDSEAG